MSRNVYSPDPARPHRRPGVQVGRRASVAALTVDPGQGRKFRVIITSIGFDGQAASRRKACKAIMALPLADIVCPAQAKRVKVRGALLFPAPHDCAYVARARARLDALPPGFTDWIWDMPAGPEDAPEILGPVR